MRIGNSEGRARRRLIRSSLVAILLVAGVVLAGAGSALAATWTVGQPPPAGLPSGHLKAVGCSSAGTCMAVGYYNGVDVSSGPSQFPMAETWNGSSWTLAPVPAPPGDDGTTDLGSQLLAVSCSGASACVAVGDSAPINGGTGTSTPFTEIWDGHTWTLGPALSLTGELDGVSCTSATACTAVGDVITNGGNTQNALVERWNGTVWTRQTTPAAGLYVSLASVSCTSATACLAVGQDIPGTLLVGDRALAEVWNGSAWRVTAVSLPAYGAFYSELTSVSCTAAWACTAIGTDDNFLLTTGAAIAERWNGLWWSRQSLPAASSESLNAISCSSATACVAVGTQSALLDLGVGTVAWSWNGLAWAAVATPSPAAGDALDGVSCPAPGACVAVGAQSVTAPSIFSLPVPETLAETSTAGVWSTSPSVDALAPEPGVLNGVSCSAAGACMTVGVGEDGVGGLHAAADAWNGSTWLATTFPSTSDDGETLKGVSCVGADACEAVGSSLPDQVPTALASAWSGSAWTTQTVPVPSGAATSSLIAVSCSAADACAAVGSWQADGGSVTPLVELWNGTAWTIQTIPAAPGLALTGVSCSAADACVAVGTVPASTNESEPIALMYDGSAWTMDILPSPTADYEPGLDGVSCADAGDCTAVGTVSTSADGYVAENLIDHWDGSAWTMQTAPAPAAGVTEALTAISCPAADDCTAVGSTSLNGGQPLAESWNGTSWTDVDTVPGLTGSEFESVSCVAATTCQAVGSGEDNDGLLAESES